MKDRMCGGKLLLALAAIFACSLASELKIRQDRQRAADDGLLPDNPSTDGNCRKQKENDPRVMCEADGSFSQERQSSNEQLFFCVNTDTGERLSYRYFPNGTGNCSSEPTCEKVRCSKEENKKCHDGFMLDNFCKTCECKASPAPKCPTYKEYVKSDSCTCPCVLDPSKDVDRTTETRDNCLSCNRTCTATTIDTKCAVLKQVDCPRGTARRLVGRYSEAECVEGLNKFATCTPAFDLRPMHSKKDLISGTCKQRVALGDFPVPCKEGLICKETKLNNFVCMDEATSGPCITARNNDRYLRCDTDGKFLRVQCRPLSIDGASVPNIPPITFFGLEYVSKTKPHSCYCSNPDNGKMVDGPTKEVKNRCDLFTFCKAEKCKIVKGGKSFVVQDGEQSFETSTCRSCRCRNGNPEALCSTGSSCKPLTPETDCKLREIVIPPFKVIKDRCQICNCFNGKLQCRNNPECIKNNDGENCDACEEDECKKESDPSLVCVKGNTISSRCEATQNLHTATKDIQDRHCSNQDVCNDFPCNTNQNCKKLPPPACLTNEGCTSNQRRICVNLETLSCRVADDDDSSDDEKVCGNDKNTYNSRCELNQGSSSVDSVHDGPCDDPTCKPQKICRCDGENSENRCELDYLASVRIDYDKECIDSTGLTPEKKCDKVRNTPGLCSVNRDNCNSYIDKPFTGCCPVCGGQLLVFLDINGLSAREEVDPGFAILNNFINSLLDSGLQDVSKKCNIWKEYSPSTSLYITFEGRGDGNEKFCRDKIETLVKKIKEATNPDPTVKKKRQEDSEELTQAFLYVTGSVTALVEVSGAAVRLKAVAGMVTLLLLVASGMMF